MLEFLPRWVWSQVWMRHTCTLNHTCFFYFSGLYEHPMRVYGVYTRECAWSPEKATQGGTSAFLMLSILLRQGLSLHLKTAGGQETPAAIFESLTSFHWCFRFLVPHMAFLIGCWAFELWSSCLHNKHYLPPKLSL